MTPRGVEHKLIEADEAEAPLVKPTMTPRGVEHSAGPDQMTEGVV